MLRQRKGIVIALSAAIVWTFALFYSQNILLYNAHWLPYHASPFGVGVHGLEQLLSRRILAGFQFNDGHAGLQHNIVSRKDFAFKEIRFTAVMNARSKLVLGIATPEGKTGIRFSSHKLIPSLTFRKKKNESDPHKELINYQIPGGTNDFLLRRESDGLRVFLNGKEAFKVPLMFPEGRIYLRGYKVTVKSFAVDSDLLPFSPDISFWRLLWPVALGLGVVGFFSIKVPVLLLISGLLWTTFDYFHYSRSMVLFNARDLSYESADSPLNFEKYRGEFFGKWFELLADESARFTKLKNSRRIFKSFGSFRKCGPDGCQRIPTDDFSPLAATGDHNLRILMVGGSLISGWGTLDLDDYYPATFHRFLRENLKKEVQIVTASAFLPSSIKMSPADLARLTRTYNPHVVLLEVHSATIGHDVLNEAILAKKNGAKVIVYRAPKDIPSSEPDEIQTATSYVKTLPDDEMMKKYAFPGDREIIPKIREANVRFLDTNEFFYRPEIYRMNAYFIDDVHLSKSGHRALGKYLGNELLDEIRKIAGE